MPEHDWEKSTIQYINKMKHILEQDKLSIYSKITSLELKIARAKEEGEFENAFYMIEELNKLQNSKGVINEV